MELKQLIFQRATAWERMRELNDLADAEKRCFSADEQAEWDRLSPEVDRLTNLIEAIVPGNRADFESFVANNEARMNKVLGLSTARAAVSGDEAVLDREQRMTDWLAARDQLGPWAKESLSLGRTMLGMATGRWDHAEAERRAMSESSDTAGGFLLPTPLASWVIDAARAEAVVLAAGARTVPMTSETGAIAVVTADPVASWRQELSTITPVEGPSLGRLNLTARSLVVDVIASRELLMDAPNAAAELEKSMRETLALKLDYAALAGQGAAAEPKGLRTYTAGDGINITALLPNGFPYSHDYALAVINDILADNSPMPTAMIMNPRTRANGIAQLKTGDGLPLPAPDLVRDLKMFSTTQVAVDDTQGTSSNATRVFIGHFPEMLIGIRQNILLEASQWAPGATEKHAVLFRAHLRADVALAHAASFGVIEGILPN